jgi:hydroxymethylbilane synthase
MSATTRPVRIGTRGSKLALAQTALVIDALQAAHPGLSVSVQRITTRGDVIAEAAPSVIGDKALFVGDIEDALLRGEIDLAVHSAKDMPSVLPDELILGAYLPRADPRDAFISRTGATLDALPPGARVGTSSMRRAAQLRALRPDLEVVEIRGTAEAHGVRGVRRHRARRGRAGAAGRGPPDHRGP